MFWGVMKGHVLKGHVVKGQVLKGLFTCGTSDNARQFSNRCDTCKVAKVVQGSRSI